MLPLGAGLHVLQIYTFSILPSPHPILRLRCLTMFQLLGIWCRMPFMDLPISTQGFFSGDILGFVGAGVGWGDPLGASSLFILVAFPFLVTFAIGFGIFGEFVGDPFRFFLGGARFDASWFCSPGPRFGVNAKGG